MTRLKCCPFCGSGEPSLILLTAPFDAGFASHIHCQACGAKGGEAYQDGDSPPNEKASKLWNMRSPADKGTERNTQQQTGQQ